MIVTSTTGITATAPAPAPATKTTNGVAKESRPLEQPTQPVELVQATEEPVPAPVVSKAEKEALNTVKTEQVQQVEEQQQLSVKPELQPEPVAVAEVVPEAVTAPTEPAVVVASSSVEEKADGEGNEKPQPQAPPREEVAAQKKTSRNGSKENSEVRELTPPTLSANDGSTSDLMTASMIAKKITTEEEAKAALAERRRLAREEAERQAELERQRLEAERLAELKAQEEEAERQRLFEEESTRLAEEQRRGEEERLRKAIEVSQASSCSIRKLLLNTIILPCRKPSSVRRRSNADARTRNVSASNVKRPKRRPRRRLKSNALRWLSGSSVRRRSAKSVANASRRLCRARAKQALPTRPPRYELHLSTTGSCSNLINLFLSIGI